MFNREKAIQELVGCDIDTINNAEDYLRGILEGGFIGYSNMSDEELMDELECRDISYVFGENDD